jgi:hypothetical protein
MLGGAATYIGLAASYFAPVKIVAVVEDDFAEEDMNLLTSHKIDVAVIERVKGGARFILPARSRLATRPRRMRLRSRGRHKPRSARASRQATPRRNHLR